MLLARTPEELALPSAAPVRGVVDARAEEEDEGWPRRIHAGAGADPFAARAVAEHGPDDDFTRDAPTPPRWTARLLRRKGLRPTDAPRRGSGPRPDAVRGR